MSVSNDPDVVLQEILATKPRPQKVQALNAIHELCRAHHDSGGRDFSVLAIGKLCEEKGLLTARGLYNSSSADHRKLIEAWARLAGPAPVKVKKTLSTDEFVMEIKDPAIRMLVQTTIAERNKLKSDLNILRKAKVVEVDRRPVVDAEPLVAISARGLTDSEREALKQAVSKQFIEDQGWEERDLGEIINQRGKTLFAPGFTTGLRKLLGAL